MKQGKKDMSETEEHLLTWMKEFAPKRGLTSSKAQRYTFAM